MTTHSREQVLSRQQSLDAIEVIMFRHWVERMLSKLDHVLHREAVQRETIPRKEVDHHLENHLQQEHEQTQEAQHVSDEVIHSTEVTNALEQ